jgi:hypothetical protein
LFGVPLAFTSRFNRKIDLRFGDVTLFAAVVFLLAAVFLARVVFVVVVAGTLDERRRCAELALAGLVLGFDRLTDFMRVFGAREVSDCEGVLVSAADAEVAKLDICFDVVCTSRDAGCGVGASMTGILARLLRVDVAWAEDLFEVVALRWTYGTVAFTYAF